MTYGFGEGEGILTVIQRHPIAPVAVDSAEPEPDVVPEPEPEPEPEPVAAPAKPARTRKAT